jgi:hypothetical protein
LVSAPAGNKGMSMGIRIILFNYAVFLLLLFPVALPGNGFAEELPQPKIGAAAPAFNLQTLQGTKLSLSDQHGKFVVIHFATSW